MISTCKLRAVLSGLCILLASAPRPAWGQESNVEWDVVSPDELRDTVFALDGDASAVILYERGYASFNEEYDLEYRLHRRIRILTSEGFEFGTVSISYEDRDQNVDDVEGHTMILKPDGSVSKVELDGDDIFDEVEIGTRKRVTFTLPALQPGCIIEYRYRKTSVSPHYMPAWYFQNSEPTLWSEFIVEIPEVFNFAAVSYPGFLEFLVQESRTTKQTFTRHGQARMSNVALSRWVMKDAPAIRREEYMTSPRDYMAQVRLQLSQVNWPGEIPVNVLQTWDVLVEELSGHHRFGGAIDPSGDVQGAVRALGLDPSDTLATLRAVHRFVSANIVWNDYHSAFVTTDLDEVLEKKTGSSGDINLLLVAMLRAAGYDAVPVLVSTRSHGKIQRLYPMVAQFNTVLCAVTVGGNRVMMDGTDRWAPFNLLPSEYLNQTGLLISGETFSWVDISPVGENHSQRLANLALDGGGSVTGNLYLQFSEYAGVEERQTLQSAKSDDYVKGFIEDAGTGVTIDSVVVENLDSTNLPLKVRAAVTLGSHVQMADSFMYLNPNIFPVGANPFARESRHYPVDFGYGISRTMVINLSLPPDFDVVEIPPDVEIPLPNRAGSYSRKIRLMDRTLQYQAKASVRQLVFHPHEYKPLRAMYERMITSRAEQIVLKKRR